MARGEVLTENVSHNVEKTATAVQSAVTTPLINLSSLIAGVSKGFNVWGRSATHGGHCGRRQGKSDETLIKER